MREELPPVVSNEWAPGYMICPVLEMWVLAHEYTIVLDVYQEINQYDFRGRKHGTCHLKNLGCKGPLCKKAKRDYVRRNDTSTSEAYKRKWARYDELLELLQKWHETELAKPVPPTRTVLSS